MLLEGKVAIVSGIGPGHGPGHLARVRPARAPTSCSAAARETELEAVADEVEALGVGRCPMRLRHRRRRRRARPLADAAAAELGRLDILVNNAYHGGDAKALHGRRPRPTGARRIEVNLFGTLAHDPGRRPAPRGARRRAGDHDQHDVDPAHRGEVGRLRRRRRARSQTVTKTLAARARPEGHPGQRHPPRLHLRRLGRVVLQPPGREAGHHVPGGVRRGRVGDLPRVPAALRGDRRHRRVLRLATSPSPSPAR